MLLFRYLWSKVIIILILKMINEIIDYRNGKYQGFISFNQQRNGLGIFIDDDLTFYITHWNQNKLQGLTLVYISHGKYTYGEWRDNQPHGLNVFRFGDTVLLGMFQEGKPINKCLIIFEKFNIACILQQNQGSWSIIQSGSISSYKSLIKFIGMIDVNVPDYYFSLTKFACRFSNNAPFIKTYPCMNNSCYFGYHNGLALIFNSNNGLISIGNHNNQQLCEFGGRYEGNRSSEEGNFEIKGQRVTYFKQRPKAKVYSIFKKLHQKSLNFINQYYDPKIKFFTNIQNFLRNKLEQITNEISNFKQFENISLNNINNSLDYQQYNEEQSIKINSIRDKLYSPNNRQIISSNSNKNTKNQLQINIDQSLSQQKYFIRNDKNNNRQFREQYTEPIGNRTKNSSKITTPSNKSENINNIYINKSPLKQKNKSIIDSQKVNAERCQTISSKDYQLKQSFTPSKLRQRNNTKYLIKNENKQELKNNSKSNKIYKQNFSSKNQEERVIEKNDDLRNYEIENLPKFKELIQQISNKKINIYKKQLNNEAKIYYGKNKEIGMSQQENSQQQKARSKSNKRPSLNKSKYENLEQRKKRILKDYKGLNNINDNIEENKKYQHKNNIQDKSKMCNISYTITQNHNQKNVISTKIQDLQKRYGLSHQRKDNSHLRQAYLKQKKQNEFNYNAYTNFQLKERQTNNIFKREQNQYQKIFKKQNIGYLRADNKYNVNDKSNNNSNKNQQSKVIQPLRPKRNYTYIIQ